MSERMKRSFKNVLAKLADRPAVFVPAHQIPNGHGHTHPRGATGSTLSEMKLFGLIEYGKPAGHSHYGWKITSHGLSVFSAALAKAKGEA